MKHSPTPNPFDTLEQQWDSLLKTEAEKKEPKKESSAPWETLLAKTAPAEKSLDSWEKIHTPPSPVVNDSYQAVTRTQENNTELAKKPVPKLQKLTREIAPTKLTDELSKAPFPEEDTLENLPQAQEEALPTKPLSTPLVDLEHALEAPEALSFSSPEKIVAEGLTSHGILENSFAPPEELSAENPAHQRLIFSLQQLLLQRRSQLIYRFNHPQAIDVRGKTNDRAKEKEVSALPKAASTTVDPTEYQWVEDREDDWEQAHYETYGYQNPSQEDENNASDSSSFLSIIIKIFVYGFIILYLFSNIFRK